MLFSWPPNLAEICLLKIFRLPAVIEVLQLEESVGQLTYLVGINFKGDRVLYEPMNQAAADHADQTPLPRLAMDPDLVSSDAEDSMQFAKFGVAFTPPGVVQIDSWMSIPIVWLGIAVYMMISLASLYQIALK
jgi:hypothetical protein